MFVDTSASLVKSQISAMLVAYQTGSDDGEAVALDIVELIAWRMRWRDDYEVGLLGLYVRTHMVALNREAMSFALVVDRVTSAAIAAPQGHAVLMETLEGGLGDLLF